MGEKNQLEELPEDWTNALAVIAHPDDMEYGAASAVARWTSQGKKVSYLLVTRGEAGIDAMTPEETGTLREVEERNSAQLVGVKDVVFLDYPDGVVEYGLPLRKDIARVIRQKQPEILITVNFRLTWDGGMLNMADHRWVALAVMDAARDAGNRWIFPELLKEGYQPWDGVRMVCLNGSPQSTHAVDVTGYLDAGIASLKEHRVYIENLPVSFNPENFLRESAAATGVRFGCPFAVGFEVINI
jgi:LmbE family N-acetylglucosaminyl deacetylase